MAAKTWQGGLLGAAGLALLAACATQPVPKDLGAPTTRRDEDVTVLVSQPLRYGMQALGGGRLEAVGGCLGAAGSVVVWPSGTEVVAKKPLTIKVPNYGTFAMGDKLRIGGGFVVEHSSDDVEPGPLKVGGTRVPAECAKHDVFLASPS